MMRNSMGMGEEEVIKRTMTTQLEAARTWMRTKTWVMTWKQTIIIMNTQGLNTTIWPHHGDLKALERACLQIRPQEILPTPQVGMILVWAHLVGEVQVEEGQEEHQLPQVQLKLGQKDEQNKLKVWILFSMHTCDKAWLR
jgi:hypothetical protein